jgi:hypothetical protein
MQCGWVARSVTIELYRTLFPALKDEDFQGDTPDLVVVLHTISYNLKLMLKQVFTIYFQKNIRSKIRK